jgi:hypothetical protein
MSKQFDKLEEIFELPDLDLVKELPATSEDVHAALEHAEEIGKEFDKIDHFDQHDEEMDELAELAKQAHKDLQELGMNVEVKHAGEIFSSSSQMLKIAVDAKNLKVEKKLKMLKLQLDKMRIDRMGGQDNGNTVEGTAVALDRNEILKHLRQMNGGDK